MKLATICIIASVLFTAGCNPSSNFQTPSGNTRFTAYNIQGVGSPGGGPVALLRDNLTGREFLLPASGGIAEIRPKEEKP